MQLTARKPGEANRRPCSPEVEKFLVACRATFTDAIFTFRSKRVLVVVSWKVESLGR